MLKIYDKKEDVPEEFLEHYAKRSDGKYEPQVEGINSIFGLLTKRDELLEKVKEIPTLKARISEFEGQEVLTTGKVAVDKKQFDELTTENEAYKALGTLDEIKPKVEGFEDLKTQTKQALRDKALMAAGVTDLDRARRFKSYDELEIESEIKDGKEIFYSVRKDDKGKELKTAFDNDVLKSDGFKDDLGSLLGESGTKMFKQGTTTGTTEINPVETKMAKYSPPASAAIQTN